MHFGSTFCNTGDYSGDGALEGEGTVSGIGMPIWAIVLLVIGGLLVVAIVAIGTMVYLRKKKMPTV